MSNNSLITPAEVVRYSPVSNDFPLSQLYGQVKAEEWLLFIQYIGEDFYELLLADLVDYSSVPQWDGGPYAAGDHVMEQGMIFTSLIDANETEIGDPLNEAAWKEADKFTTACYNSLWTTGFLRELLAYAVILPAVTHTTYPTGAAGTVQKYEDMTGIRTAANPNYAKVIDELQRGKNMRLRLVAKYISDNSEGCNFSGTLYGANCNTLGAGAGRARKIFYR